MRHYLTLFFLIFFSSLSFAQISAKDIVINADNMVRDASQKVILTGNVQLIFDNSYLAADKATIWLNEKRLIASGNVVLQNPTSYIQADRVTYNYATEEGLVYNGFVQSGQMVISSDLIKRTGENSFEAKNASFTSCKNCPPSWSIDGAKIKAKIGGYATIKYPVLRVATVPIFALPALILPLKSERQSGLLTPSFGVNGNDGSTYTLPVFWAIDRDKDMTFKETYLDRRGWKTDVQYRQVFNEKSFGEFNTGYIYDKRYTEGLDNDSDPIFARQDRFYLKYKQFFDFGNDLFHRADLKFISDLRYLRDFANDVQLPGQSSLENNISVTKNWKDQHLSVEAQFNFNLLRDDLIRTTDSDEEVRRKEKSFLKNSDSVHRLPEIKYSIIEQSILDSNVMFNFDASYVNFFRSKAYDDICVAGESCNGQTVPDNEKRVSFEDDGQFDSGKDIIRAGQRLMFKPTLSYPFQIGRLFNVVPRVSYSEEHYFFGDEITDNSNTKSYAARKYMETDLSIRTEFSKVYGDRSEEKAALYRHIIEPQISYTNIPWIDRPDHEFFGEFAGQPFRRSSEEVSNNDFFGNNGLQFDYNDRVFDRKLLRIGVTNRVLRKIWSEDRPKYQEVMLFQLSQAYDFDEADRVDPRPWATMDSLIRLRLDNVFFQSRVSYFPYADVINSDITLRISSNRGHYINLTYNEDFNIDEDDNAISELKTNNGGLGLGFSSRIFNFRGALNHSFTQNKLLNWNIQAQYKPPGECWTIGTRIEQVLDTERDVNYDFFFEFDFDQS